MIYWEYKFIYWSLSVSGIVKENEAEIMSIENTFTMEQLPFYDLMFRNKFMLLMLSSSVGTSCTVPGPASNVYRLSLYFVKKIIFIATMNIKISLFTQHGVDTIITFLIQIFPYVRQHYDCFKRRDSIYYKLKSIFSFWCLCSATWRGLRVHAGILQYCTLLLLPSLITNSSVESKELAKTARIALLIILPGQQ